MSDLISRDVLRARLGIASRCRDCKNVGKQCSVPGGGSLTDLDICKAIDEVPNVDAVRVVHANWNRGRNGTALICSNCYNRWHWFEDKEYADIFARENKFCSNCGAKMCGEVVGHE